MSKLFYIVLISFVGVVMVDSVRLKNPELKLMSQILNGILDSIENRNIPELIETTLEARLAIQRIITRYESCESQDAPSSTLQKTLKIVCVNMGHVNLVTELFFVIRDFSAAYAKRGFKIDHLYETVKHFFAGNNNKIIEDIISKFLPSLFRLNQKQSVSSFDYKLEQAQEKFIETLLDLDFDYVDMVSQFLSSAHTKYSKPSKHKWEAIDLTLKEILMEELDIDEDTLDIVLQSLSFPHKKYSEPYKYKWEAPDVTTLREILTEELDIDEDIADIMIEQLSSPSQRPTNIEDIIQELFKETD